MDPAPGFKTRHFYCNTLVSEKNLKGGIIGLWKRECEGGSHKVNRLTCHIVWVTKYRYHVLEGDIMKRCRELIIQVCEGEKVQILKGVMSKDHIHIHIEYPPRVSISHLVKWMKGRSLPILQKEYPSLQKRYWGKHFWAMGYGAWELLPMRWFNNI